MRVKSNKKKPIFLFILVDALGWEYIKDKTFLSNILPFRKKLSTLLGFSCACIPSILSGKYPDEHGQWNLFYYSPETSPFKWTKWIPYFGSGLTERVSRKIIEIVSKKISKGDGYFETYGVPLTMLHLFDISERKNIYEPEGLNNVSSIFDWMIEKNIKYRCYNYRQGPDISLLNMATSDIGNEYADVFFLYLAQMDSFLHENCLDTEYVDGKITFYKNEISSLYETAKKSGREVRMAVFSDHGMVPTMKTIDLMSFIERLGLKQPEDYLAIYDSTMGRFWCFSEKARASIVSVLETIEDGSILTEAELKNNHIWFKNHLYGDIIFLLKPGILIEPSHMGKKAPAGMHGCHPDDPFCDAMVMANHDFLLERQDITTLFYLMQNEMKKYLL